MDEKEFYSPHSTEVIDGICIETYHIDVPFDLFDNTNDRAEYAIYSAREGCSVWIVPANWSVESDDGETVVVKRFYRSHGDDNG